MIDPSIIDIILQRAGFVSKDVVAHGWIISVDNKILLNGANCWIFPSRDAAVKALYNATKWRAHCATYENSAAGRAIGRHLTDEEIAVCSNYKLFKNYLIRHRNLQFIHI